MASISVCDVLNKLGLTENDDTDNKHKFLMKHIIQLEAEIAGLKHQLDDERIQFSSYIDQISRLNGTREELILEYESREREMQQEIFSLMQQLQSYRNSETRDMLINQGLVDIADSTPGQQVAHLLIDRARLMDVIDELKQKLMSHSSFNNHHIAEQSNGATNKINSSNDFKPASDIDIILSKVQQLEVNNKLLFDKFMQASLQNPNELPGNTTNKSKFQDPNEVFDHPKSIEEAAERLKLLEANVKKVKFLEMELQAKEAEIKRLNLAQIDFFSNHSRGQKELPDEGLCSRDEQTSSELYWKHGEKIEFVLKSVEEQLRNMRSFSEQKNETVLTSNQLQALQKEFEHLKVELLKMISKYDSQANKYRDHKLNCKNKIFKLKEAFKNEKQEFLDKIEELQNRLELNSELMNRELEYKKNLEKTVENLISEQRTFMNQLSVQEETILNQRREINMLSKSKHLQIEISSDKHLSFAGNSDLVAGSTSAPGGERQ